MLPLTKASDNTVAIAQQALTRLSSNLSPTPVESFLKEALTLSLAILRDQPLDLLKITKPPAAISALYGSLVFRFPGDTSLPLLETVETMYLAGKTLLGQAGTSRLAQKEVLEFFNTLDELVYTSYLSLPDNNRLGISKANLRVEVISIVYDLANGTDSDDEEAAGKKLLQVIQQLPHTSGEVKSRYTTRVLGLCEQYTTELNSLEPGAENLEDFMARWRTRLPSEANFDACEERFSVKELIDNIRDYLGHTIIDLINKASPPTPKI